MQDKESSLQSELTKFKMTTNKFFKSRLQKVETKQDISSYAVVVMIYHKLLWLILINEGLIPGWSVWDDMNISSFLISNHARFVNHLRLNWVKVKT